MEKITTSGKVNLRDYKEMKGKNECGLGKEVEKVAKISIFLTHPHVYHINTLVGVGQLVHHYAPNGGGVTKGGLQAPTMRLSLVHTSLDPSREYSQREGVERETLQL